MKKPITLAKPAEPAKASPNAELEALKAENARLKEQLLLRPVVISNPTALADQVNAMRDRIEALEGEIEARKKA